MPDRPERNPESAADMQRLRGASAPMPPSLIEPEGNNAIGMGLLAIGVLAVIALLLFTGIIPLPHDARHADTEVRQFLARSAANNDLPSLMQSGSN